MDVNKLYEIKEKYNSYYNNYKDLIIKRVNIYNYRYANKDDFIEYCSLLFLLTYHTDLSFLEIDKFLKNDIFKGWNVYETLLYKDLIQYNIKECCIIKFNTSKEFLKRKFEGSYEEIEERMFYRKELYKEGWNADQIEKYIYRYLLNNKQLILDNIDEYDDLYYNLFLSINLNRKEYKKSIGRPKLPDSIREHINIKVREKIKENMRSKYIYSNMYEKIKNNLLTKDEFEILKNKIDDQNMVEKLSNLVLQ
jgi:hypothetical protein